MLTNYCSNHQLEAKSIQNMHQLTWAHTGTRAVMGYMSEIILYYMQFLLWQVWPLGIISHDSYLPEQFRRLVFDSIVLHQQLILQTLISTAFHHEVAIVLLMSELIISGIK